MAFPKLSPDAEVRSWTLDAERELRFEVVFSSVVELQVLLVIHIKLLQGTAEVFGSEIAPLQKHQFSGAKVAVFSWHGCSLEVKGKTTVEYISDETPMNAYINTHFALESLRCEAADKGKVGPRVLVVGPSDSGKTSLCKILLNYAIRMERAPIYCDLDITEVYFIDNLGVNIDTRHIGRDEFIRCNRS